jgi:hypothetical protein
VPRSTVTFERRDREARQIPKASVVAVFISGIFFLNHNGIGEESYTGKVVPNVATRARRF